MRLILSPVVHWEGVIPLWWACRQYVITVIPLIPGIWSLLALAPSVVSMQAVCDHSDPTDPQDLILAGPGPRYGEHAGSMWSQWSPWSPGSDPCWPWLQVWWACRQYVITVILKEMGVEHCIIGHFSAKRKSGLPKIYFTFVQLFWCLASITALIQITTLFFANKKFKMFWQMKCVLWMDDIEILV